MIELMKQLLGLNTSDRSKDTIFKHYLTKAQNAIKNYLNADELIGYDDSIVDLAIFYYKNPDGITTKIQGNREQRMVDGIPESIKCTLPKPRVKVVG